MFAVEDAWLLLLICPPPPGLAPACLFFTSWVSSCLVALHLLGELLPASCPSPPEMDLELQESITMALLVECWCGWENRGVLLVVLWMFAAVNWAGLCLSCPGRVLLMWLCCCACMLASNQLSRLSCLWAARLFSTQTRSDPPGTWCDGGLDTQILCTPFLNRTDTILDPNTQWCKWQYKFPKSESNLILTLTLFCFICSLLCRLLIKDQHGDLEDEIDSLELGFFYFSLL
jgi:hypothetical protein